MSSSSSDSEESGVQIRVCLTLLGTKGDDETHHSALQVSSDPIAVPADAGRKGLSAIVNHLLDRSDDESIPFEFIVGSTNRLLRTGLEREARRSGLSLEEALPVTYFVAQRSPEATGEGEKQDDWIDTLCYSKGNVFAGCYDGSLLCYTSRESQKTSQVALHQPLKLSSLHSGPIKALATTELSDENFIASGSMDQTIKLVRQRKAASLGVVAEYTNGHVASITCLGFTRHLLASGDWNGGLCLWDTTEALEGSTGSQESPTPKKAKTSTSKKSTADNPVMIHPKAQIRAHVSSISGMSWGNHNVASDSVSSRLITGSWDHGIKLWDMEREDCLLTLNGAKVVSCLDTSYYTEGIVATGHPDHSIRLWDTRVDPKNDDIARVSDKSFRTSHKGWVTAVQWSPHTPFHLASVSHDGSMKLWDIRSPLPLHTTTAFPSKEKGLCLVYGPLSEAGANFFTAGTDCRVKHFQCRIPMKQ